MGQLLLFVVVALVVAAIVFGVTVMVSGGDSGLTPVEPDGKALPLPVDRPLGEEDVARSRFDTAFRGYRMAQVDQALQRAAYDIGYKNELIGVLEAEVTALRDGRTSDADALRRAREASVAPQQVTVTAAQPEPGIDAAPQATGADTSPVTGNVTKSDSVPAAKPAKDTPTVADTTKDAAEVPAQAPAGDAGPEEVTKPTAVAGKGAGKTGGKDSPATGSAGAGNGKQAERR